jgi:NAD(P)-dependent dehydrogenase (short-subunit alcohol dehydrogenase family)
MGRLAAPDDIAAVIAYLTLRDMGQASGQIMYVDGGYLSAMGVTR